MADRVQFIMDRMALTFREMEQFEIFTQEEVKSVVKKRTEYEYKLRRRQQTPADYYGYLKYELGLEELRVLRCRKQSSGQRGQNSDADFSKELINKHRKLQSAFLKHISYVFERALRRFPDNMTLWKDYIGFLQEKQAHSTLNTVFGRALSLHPKNESLWLQAAVFEINKNSNAHAARVLLQRALRVNKHSEQLWQTYFELELWYVERAQERRRMLGLKVAGAGIPSEPSEDDHLGVPWVVYRHATKNLPALGFAMNLLKATGAGCARGDVSSALQLEIHGDLLSRFGGTPAYWSAMVQLSTQGHVSNWQQQQQLQKVVTKKLQKKRSLQDTLVDTDTNAFETASTLVSRLRVVSGGLTDSLSLLEECRATAPFSAETPLSSPSSTFFFADCLCDVLDTLSPVLSVPVEEDVTLSELDLFRSQQPEEGKGEGEAGSNALEVVLDRLDDITGFLRGEEAGLSGAAQHVQEPRFLAAKLGVTTLQALLFCQYSELLRSRNNEMSSANPCGYLESTFNSVLSWLKGNSTDPTNVDMWSLLAERAFRAHSVLEMLTAKDGWPDKAMLELCATVLARGAKLLNSSSHLQRDSDEQLKTRVLVQAVEGALLRQSEGNLTASVTAVGGEGALVSVQTALEKALLGRAPVSRKTNSESEPYSDRVYVSWLLRYIQLGLLHQGTTGWRAACEFVEKRCFDARPHCVATLSLKRYYEEVLGQGMSLLRTAQLTSAGSRITDSLADAMRSMVAAAVSRCPSSSSSAFLAATEELQRREGRHDEANHTRWKRGRAF